MRQFDKYVIIKLVTIRYILEREVLRINKKWVLGIYRTIKDNQIVLAYFRSIRHLVMYMVPHGRFARPRGAGTSI